MMLIDLIVNSPLLALFLGPLVTYIGNRGQELITVYDRLPPIGKQAVAVALAFVFVGLTQLLPGVVPESCADVAATGLNSDCIAGLTSKDFINAVLAGLVAIAVKHGKQKPRR